MLAWLAGDNEMLDTIRSGRDPYKEFIVAQRGVAYDDVTKAQRTYAKPVILGCGYGLGGAGLVAYAGSMGVDMDETEAWSPCGSTASSAQRCRSCGVGWRKRQPKPSNVNRGTSSAA